MNQRRIDKIEKLNSKVQKAVDKYQDTIQYLECKIQNLLDEMTEEEMEYTGYYTIEDVTQDIVI